MAHNITSTAATPDIMVIAKEFRTLLEAEGLHGALRFLNGRTRHRFTGVYRLSPSTLHNICLFDRENPSIRVGSETPLHETYCAIIADQGGPVAFDDSTGKPFQIKRTTVMSYCGVPLWGADGSAWGTLCHFDLRPRIVPRAELPLMEAVAPLILEAVQK